MDPRKTTAGTFTGVAGWQVIPWIWNDCLPVWLPATIPWPDMPDPVAVTIAGVIALLVGRYVKTTQQMEALNGTKGIHKPR